MVRSLKSRAFVRRALLRRQPFGRFRQSVNKGYRRRLHGLQELGQSESGLHITFLVPDSVPHYIFAWEERDPRKGNTGDYDYNDFVAEMLHRSDPRTRDLRDDGAGLRLMGSLAHRRKGRVPAS